MSKRSKHQYISFSWDDAKLIQESARFSGYELNSVEQKIGKIVLERLGIDPHEALSHFVHRNTYSVTVYIDTLNLNGVLTGKQNFNED